MGVAMFASMWISNVAAPVLCFSIIQVRHNLCELSKHSTNATCSQSYEIYHPTAT
jgi:phosphate transporter